MGRLDQGDMMARKQESGMLLGSPENSYARQRLAPRGPSPPARAAPCPALRALNIFCCICAVWPGAGAGAAAGCRLHVCGAAPRLQHNCSRCTLQAGQLTREPRTAQLTSTAALQHTRSTIAAAAVRPKFGYFCDIGPVNFVPRPKVQGVQESTAVCSPEQVLQQYCSGSSLHMLATLLLQSENSAE